MRTKFYLLLIALVTTIGSAFGQNSGTVSGSIIWEFNSGVLTISNTIPSSPEAMPTNWVAHTASSGVRPDWEGSHHSDITKVVITSGITTIGVNAFSGYENLVEVDLEGATDLTDIGNAAFLECAKLTTVKMSESITRFGQRIFRLSGITEVTIPKSLEIIDNDVFYPTPDLEKFIVAAGNTHFKLDDEGKALLSIDGSVFVAYPAALADTEYTLPATVTTFAVYISAEGPHSVNHFIGNKNLTAIKVANGNTTYKEVSGVLFSADGKTLVAYPSGKSGNHYEIPYGVELIGGRVFAYNGGLKTVDIPNSVTMFDYQAFNTSCLEEITIPKSVTFIGNHCFAGSKFLKKAAFDGDPEMLYFLFNGCTSLTTVEFKNLTKTNEYMFGGCTSLVNVNLGNNLKELAPNTFNGCISLEELIIPNSLESFERAVFMNCASLTDLTIQNVESPELSSNTSNFIISGVKLHLPEGYNATGDYLSVWQTKWGATISSETFYLVLYKSDDVIYHSEMFLVSVGDYTLTRPTDPIKIGYTFEGWYDDLDVLVPFDGTEYNDHITLTAKWNAIPATVTTRPADNSNNVSITSEVVLTFNVPMDTNEGVVTVNSAVVAGVWSGGNTYTISNDLLKLAHRGNYEVAYSGFEAQNGTVIADGSFTFRVESVPVPSYTVTIEFLTGVTLERKTAGTHPVDEGGSFGFGATADARGYSVIVYVDGTEHPAISDNFYLIENIRGDKTVTFKLAAGTYNENSIVGGITINGESLNDKKTDYPTSGKIVITFNDDADTNVSGKVIIDGKEVPGTWGTDSNGNPTYTIDYAVTGDGEHTIKIEGFGGDGETHTFTTGGGSGNNNNNNTGGKIVIDGSTPDLGGGFPPTGEIVVYPPVVTYPETPTVTIDGETVTGSWEKDEDGKDIYVIGYDDLEDGEHTIIIDGEEFTFEVEGENGNSGNTGGSGKVVIDENTPSDLDGDYPPSGEIVVYPPVVTFPETPTVTIDGEEVPGAWTTDEDGKPIYVIDYEGLEDGKHTLVIGDKTYTFTTSKNAGATSNDVLSTATVTAGYGTVTIDTPKSSTVYVVSLSGSVVYNAKVVGTVTVNVPSGIYVVVVDGVSTKIVVR